MAPDIAAAEGIIASRIPAGKFRRYFSLWNAVDAFTVVLGAVAAFWKMFLIMPDAVFSKGGFGSFPVTLASRLYRIPFMVHDSDAVPGRVNRWAGKWARRVAVSFPGAARYFPAARTALTGVPIRSRISGGKRTEGQEVFGLYAGRPALFALGGSQGAAVINQNLIQILRELLAAYALIHQAGEKNFEDVRLETAAILEGEVLRGGPRPEGGGETHYRLMPFLSEDQMRSAYALSDLVIARAGGTVIFELAAVAKPAILIPIKIAAQDHQRANAYEYARSGAAVVIEEDNLTPSVLLHEIKTLMADPERRAKMSEAAKAFARSNAAEVIAKELLALGLH